MSNSSSQSDGVDASTSVFAESVVRAYWDKKPTSDWFPARQPGEVFWQFPNSRTPTIAKKWPPLQPVDHRYDKIVEEFCGKPLLYSPPPEPLIWTPPPGTFPKDEEDKSTTEVSFPKIHQDVGRWKCSVVAVVKILHPFPSKTYRQIMDIECHCWLQAEPTGDTWVGPKEFYPTYQKWMDGAPKLEDLRYAFLDWVQDIEAHPDCCVRHKMIGKYDGSPCHGIRREKPPLALAPDSSVVGASIYTTLWATTTDLYPGSLQGIAARQGLIAGEQLYSWAVNQGVK
jgi:hypothetical protein